MKKIQFKKVILFSSAVIASVLIFLSCEKSGISNQSKQISIYLTDHPAQFDKVLVDITSLEVKIDTSTHRFDDNFGTRPDHMDHHEDDGRMESDEFGYWKPLDIQAGVYDLLTLRNGIDTLLATGTTEGKIRKIRISINSVKVIKDSVEHPVILLPGFTNVLYIKVHDKHMQSNSTENKIWIDFDISRSIKEMNGEYFLNPVLKPFCDRNFAEIEGVVTPAEAQPYVTAISATDTATAIPMPDGRYKIRGLEEGTYTVYYKGSNGYADTTISNVQVTKGIETRLAPVTLKK